jgi:hypothetical protein
MLGHEAVRPPGRGRGGRAAPGGREHQDRTSKDDHHQKTSDDLADPGNDFNLHMRSLAITDEGFDPVWYSMVPLGDDKHFIATHALKHTRISHAQAFEDCGAPE